MQSFCRPDQLSPDRCAFWSVTQAAVSAVIISKVKYLRFCLLIISADRYTKFNGILWIHLEIRLAVCFFRGKAFKFLQNIQKELSQICYQSFSCWPIDTELAFFLPLLPQSRCNLYDILCTEHLLWYLSHSAATAPKSCWEFIKCSTGNIKEVT